MDWFRKRCAKARVKRFFGGLVKPQAEPPRKIKDLNAKWRKLNPKKKAGVPNAKRKKEVFDSIYGMYWGAPKTPPKSAFSDGKAFAYHLCLKKGYKVLGSGHYSMVVAKDGSDKVIKIGKNPTDRWIEYCKWAAENGFAGNFAPQVYSYKYLKGTESNFTISVVERLKDTFYKAVPKEHDLLSYQSLVEYKVSYGNSMAGTLVDLLIPGTNAFLDQFKAKFPNGHDLHGANIMLRDCGSVCFSDPIAGHGNCFPKRLKSKDFTDKAVSLNPEAAEAVVGPNLNALEVKQRELEFMANVVDHFAEKLFISV